MANPPPEASPKPASSRRALAALLTMAGLALALLAGGLSFVLVRQLILSRAALPGAGSPLFSSRPATPGAGSASAPQSGSRDALPTGELPLFPLDPGEGDSPQATPQLAPWDRAGRVTVLVMGLDYRDWQAGEKYSRSDTMILLTLDPLTKTAGMLSIPRDLWVAIPGFRHGKINTAYYLGEAHRLPGGGPGLAVETVELFLGVPIHYYAQVDFDAFVRFIDEIGGVKVDVPEEITIDLLGAGSATKKTLQPGVQVLPGQWALAYARARHTPGGDFDRAKRQQQVILGIRNRILSLEMLPTLVAKAPQLYQELKEGIHTNLSLTDAIRLAVLAQQVPDEGIQRGVINQAYTVFGRSPDGLSILIPIPDKVHALRDELFAVGADLGPLTPGDALRQMQAEQARLAVFNGSPDEEFGSRAAAYLREQGANLVEAGAAPEPYAATTVIDHTGNPYTLRYLVEFFQIKPNRIAIEYDPEAAFDLELYLGSDAQAAGLP